MPVDALKNQVHLKLPDRAHVSDPGITAAQLRDALDTIADYFDQNGPASVGKLNAGLVNGLALNRPIIVLPNGPISDTSYRYMKVASLQASFDGLYDILGVRLVMGSWGSLPKGVVEATFGNRGSLAGQYMQYDDLAGCGLVAYTNAGVATVYVRYPNNYRSGSLTITHNVQATVFDTWVEEVPAGTLAFDSTNPAFYPPSLLVNQAGTQLRGFLRTGAGNQGFQLTGFKSASNLTLKTTGYLELRLDDGTILKVAVVN